MFRKFLLFTVMLGSTLLLKAQDCTELKKIITDFDSAISKFSTDSSRDSQVTAKWESHYKQFKANMNEYIQNNRNSDNSMIAQILLRFEITNYINLTRINKEYDKAFDEFIQAKQKISDLLDISGAKTLQLSCGTANGKRYQIFPSDYETQTASFYASGLMTALYLYRNDEANKCFMYLHNHDLFKARNIKLNEEVSFIFKIRFDKGPVDDTLFFAAYHYLETYKDRSLIENFGNAKKNALQTIIDDNFINLKMEAKTDNKYYKLFPNYYVDLFDKLRHDTTVFSNKETIAVLKQFLKIYNRNPKGCIYWDGFRKAYSGNDNWDMFNYSKILLKEPDTEFLNMMAGLFYDYSKFNGLMESFLAAAFYRKAGDIKMAEKCLKKFLPIDYETYRKADPFIATIAFGN